MSKKKTTTTPPEVKDDPRVIEMANCMLFALQAWKNKAVYDCGTKKMHGWHQWFKQTLRDAGYDLPILQEETKTK